MSAEQLTQAEREEIEAQLVAESVYWLTLDLGAGRRGWHSSVSPTGVRLLDGPSGRRLVVRIHHGQRVELFVAANTSGPEHDLLLSAWCAICPDERNVKTIYGGEVPLTLCRMDLATAPQRIVLHWHKLQSDAERVWAAWRKKADELRCEAAAAQRLLSRLSVVFPGMVEERVLGNPPGTCSAFVRTGVTPEVVGVVFKPDAVQLDSMSLSVRQAVAVIRSLQETAE